MTPDIHSKTYVERTGFSGGVGSAMSKANPALHFQQSAMSAHTNMSHYQNLVNQSQGQNMQKMLHQHQQQLMGLSLYNGNEGQQDGQYGGDPEQIQEDMLLMSIPREGNAD